MEKKEWQNLVLKVVDTLYDKAVDRGLDRFQLVERVKIIVDGKRVK